MKPRGIRGVIHKIPILVALLLGAMFAGFPIVWVLSGAFKSNFDIFNYPPRLITQNFSFDTFKVILTDPAKVRYFINSYLVSFVVTILTLLVALLTAFSFSRYRFKLKVPLNMFIVSTQALPPITLLIPYFGLIVAVSLYNTYLALILTYMVFTLPYAILLLTGYLNTLPKELDEAAKIDGASSFKVLWRILVPIATPGIASIGIYTFMQVWNEYLFALTLTRTNDMRTVPVGIMLLMGSQTYKWNEMMGMSVLGSLPVLILLLFFQRYYISGMTAGSVKR